MLGDVAVIDAVGHGFDFNQWNMLKTRPRRTGEYAHLAVKQSDRSAWDVGLQFRDQLGR